jgi:3-methylfumaryl-CoA hydratase
MTTIGALELDIEHLRSWVGRESSATDIITEDLVRKFHATFDLPGIAPGMGAPAPCLIHFCLAQEIAPTAALGSDGHPQRGGFLPPVPLPRRMWAGGNVIFHGDLRVGDEVRRISRIHDVVVKQGRSGLLCFVKVKHVVKIADRLVIEETQDIVYRGSGNLNSEDPIPAKTGLHRRCIGLSVPLLFRYSALTFNSHRIHYDRRYATEVEGYPDLIVHGPLQATMLLNYAAELGGGSPSRFIFRGLLPLFVDDVVVLHADQRDRMLGLWTARDGGPVIMVAEAYWE